MEVVEKSFEDFLITTDPVKMDVIAIHDFLSKHSGWSANIPIERVRTSVEHSLNFGLFHCGKQIGFARVISDYSTIAYLGDVYVLREYRGKGLSSKLMDCVMSHPHLQGLRRWILLTSSAKWLYEKYNFVQLANPDIYMEKHVPEVYSRPEEDQEKTI